MEVVVVGVVEVGESLKEKSSPAPTLGVGMRVVHIAVPPLPYREERAALHKELESTKAELQDLQLKRDRVSWCSAGIAESKARLQELADCLRAALPHQVGPSYGGQMARVQSEHPQHRIPSFP